MMKAMMCFLSTFVLLRTEQQLRDFMLDEVQQFDGVGHPQHQRLQTRDQLLHAEQLKVVGLAVTGAPDVKTQRLVCKQSPKSLSV